MIMTDYKLFEISELQNGNYRFAIFATCGINPLSEICEIEKDLEKFKSSFNVLFDLFLSNGNSSNRFISAYFDGTHLCQQSFKLVKSLPNNFKKVANTFYKSQKEK